MVAQQAAHSPSSRGPQTSACRRGTALSTPTRPGHEGGVPRVPGEGPLVGGRVLYESIGKPAAEVEPEQQTGAAGSAAVRAAASRARPSRCSRPAANELAAEFSPAQDPGKGRRSDRGGTALSEGPSFRHQAALRRHRLLRDLQPRERHPRRHQARTDRGDYSPGLRPAGSSTSSMRIIFATGFDAMTGALLGIDIRGRNGVRLEDEWEGGPGPISGSRWPAFPTSSQSPGRGRPRCSPTWWSPSSSTSNGSPIASRT